MWKLTIEDDEGQRTSLDLSLEEYTVGRAEDSDIRLTERNISRNHAVIRKNEDGWLLIDEGSYNGSYVNGARANEEGLAVRAGDVVNLGDYRIEIEDSSVSAADEPARKRRPDRLICVIGPTPGSEFPLDGDRISLGRAEEATICINHASVSRLHAELHNLGQSRWEVVDQGSSNGVRINGVELRRGIIEPGDALELGDVRLRFVAAGKFYRPVVDMSQQLPGLEGMAGPAGAPSNERRMGIIGAAVAICALLGLGAYAMFSGPTTESTGPVVQPGDPRGPAALKRAQEVAGTDIQEAHNILMAIPENSTVRDSDEFQALEDQWADSMFAKADATDDKEVEHQILILISETTTVSLEKRQKAADMAFEIKPDEPKPKVVGGKRSGGGIITNPPYPQPPSGKQASADKKKKKKKKKPEPEPGGKKGDDKFNMSAQKPGLMAKMNAGTASQTELRMLMSICSAEGDMACRNQAFAAWKANKKD